MIRAAAHALADRGVAVFTLKPNRKDPATEHGFKDATTDHAAIDRMFSRTPNANLGARMGDGRYVLDVDSRHGGHESLKTLPALPFTACAETASEPPGLHLWFASPIAIPKSVSLVADGIDMCGEGSYVVVPPSIINGRRYRWTQRGSLAPMPQWLIDRAMPPKREPVRVAMPTSTVAPGRMAAFCEAAVKDAAAKIARCPAGVRNERLRDAADSLGGLCHYGHVSPSDVRAWLLWGCSQWSERDARKDEDVIDRGIRWGLDHPRIIQLSDRRAA